jgi:hypothetical protein
MIYYARENSNDAIHLIKSVVEFSNNLNHWKRSILKAINNNFYDKEYNEYHYIRTINPKYIIPSIELPKPITNIEELEIKEYFKVFFNTLKYEKTSNYRINDERGIIDDLIFHNENDAIQWIEWFKTWKEN